MNNPTHSTQDAKSAIMERLNMIQLLYTTIVRADTILQAYDILDREACPACSSKDGGATYILPDNWDAITTELSPEGGVKIVAEVHVSDIEGFPLEELKTVKKWPHHGP